MAKDPQNIDNYHRLSELYIQIEDYDKVMSVLDSLLAIKPDDVQALVGMGTMWFYEKDFRKSLSYYNKALVVNPKNYLIYYNMGNVFAEWKNFPKALFYYNRAIDLNSTNPEIYNAIALLYQDNEDYIESKGYKLEVKVYQDYVTPNKALNDGGIDANYFQHIPYLEEEIAKKGYDLSVAAKIHNEPLNLYGKEAKTEWNNTKVYIINDASNVERAYKLLVAEGLLTSYSVENFNAQRPVYESAIGVTIECIDAGLLHQKVSEGGYAVIPGNYALTAWGSAKASSYKVFGESTDVAYPNIIAVRTADLQSEKIKVLIEALAQPEVKAYIENTYGPTVNYVFESLID